MLSKKFPFLPGVYWFLNKKSQVLYVGKAKNLKLRLKSYQHLKNSGGKTQRLLDQAKKVKFKTLDSEFEALLIEAELIKIHQPTYNILLKDDKSPLYIYISSDAFPQVKTARLELIRKLNIKSYNLFGPYPSGYKAKQVLKFARSIFPFCNSPKKPAKKACFYSHLHLCPGACTGKITKVLYQKNISNLKLFLRGKKRRVLNNLKNQMITLSEKKDFETAAKVRDQIKILKNLTQAHPVSQPELNLPQLQQDKINEQLFQLKRLLRKFISLPANYPLQRLEAYDVSNISGKSATGSMVVFKNGLPQPSQYRHFKIRFLKTPNDPKMLAQILTRRLKHLEWPIPNLIIIDGGKTQLNACLKAIPLTIPVISIVKHPDRLLIPSINQTIFHQIKLSQSHPALILIQKLRNESHRFAKRLHLHLRRKKVLI